MWKMELHYPPLVPTDLAVLQERAVAWAADLARHGVTVNEVDELYDRARAYKRGEGNFMPWGDPDSGLSDRASFPPTMDHFLCAWGRIRQERLEAQHSRDIDRQMQERRQWLNGKGAALEPGSWKEQLALEELRPEELDVLRRQGRLLR